MDTAAFLRHILPHSGTYVIAELATGTDKDTGKPFTFWKHLEFDNLSSAAGAVEQLDAAGKTVYHACNSYGPSYDDVGRDGKIKKRIRTQQNVVACRSLYDDIDVGKPGCYASRKEAGEAVKAFVQAVGLVPTIIRSGNGLHLYWPLEEDITPAEWLRLSQLKRAVTEHYGLRIDHAADIDSARVLRPVGSHNRKNGEANEVTAMNQAGPYPVADVERKLLAYVKQHGLLVLPPAPPSKTSSAFDDLSGGVEYPPSSAHEIIKHCAALAEVAMVRGDTSEPLWRAMCGVVKNTIEGEALVHEWSAGHPDYDYDETQSKIDGWMTGPALCATFNRECSHCAECKHFGKVKSPIQLGYTGEGAAPVVEVEQPAEGSTGETQVVAPQDWPQGFHWDGQRISKAVTNADGGTDYVPFSNVLFFPTTRVRTEDGTWGLQIRANPGTGNDRTFVIPTKSVADTQGLGAALASYEVFTVGKNGRTHAQDYLQSFIRLYQVNGVETITYPHFGWYDNHSAFVIGDKKLDGKNEVDAIPGSAIDENLAAASHCGGDLNTWVDLVDTVYNRPGAEPYQFIICAALASPLVDFTKSDVWHGIPIALTGASGAGKTSAMSVACSIYGPSDKFLINGGENGSTLNAIVGMFATMRNLPIILDEVTGRTKEDIRDLLYALSNGRAKIRMTASGEPHQMNKGRWNMLSFVTGNEELSEMLNGLANHVAEATELRVFNVKIEEGFTERVWEGIDVKALIEQKLSKQYGHAGRKWLRFCLKNRVTITDLLNREMSRLAPTCRAETQERFYINTVVHALIAGRLAARMGLVRFDMDALQNWAMEQIKAMRTGRKAVSYTPEDYLAQFLSSIQGKIIITKRFRHSRTITPESVLDPAPRSAPVARQAVEDRKFFVAAPAFNTWCRDLGISPNWLRGELYRSGHLLTKPDGVRREYIGKGTNIVVSQTRILEFDYARVIGEEADDASGKVLQMPYRAAVSLDLDEEVV